MKNNLTTILKNYFETISKFNLLNTIKASPDRWLHLTEINGSIYVIVEEDYLSDISYLSQEVEEYFKVKPESWRILINCQKNIQKNEISVSIEEDAEIFKKLVLKENHWYYALLKVTKRPNNSQLFDQIKSTDKW